MPVARLSSSRPDHATSEISGRRNNAWRQVEPAVAVQTARSFQIPRDVRASAACGAFSRRHRHRRQRSKPSRPEQTHRSAPLLSSPTVAASDETTHASLARPHRRFWTAEVTHLTAAVGFLGLRRADVGGASRNGGAQRHRGENASDPSFPFRTDHRCPLLRREASANQPKQHVNIAQRPARFRTCSPGPR
jgi:hypothetical protein